MHFRRIERLVVCSALLARSTHADNVVSSCPGYNAHNVTVDDFGVTANLKLAGPACRGYGEDIEDLTFIAHYVTDSILQVRISDMHERVYQIPEQVLPRHHGRIPSKQSKLEIVLVEKPFSFAIRRRSEDITGLDQADETIFNTSGSSLIFESQYWRLRTSLPEDPHLYGLGEHTDPLRLNTTQYTRTFWNRDSGAVPEGTNLYGSHPVYFENRPGASESASHGVVLMNSNGMDVRIDRTPEAGQYLEYNVLGGIPDFYFMAGPDPLEVSRQYSEISGKAAMMPYWGLGFHQCRYGYANVFEVAEVVYNHSKAGIPLETMWTDIDYMDRFKIFTLDPGNFPLQKMREMIEHLHRHQQHYVVMVDPAIGTQQYPAFEEAMHRGILMHHQNGTLFRGVVWPGITAFPDWFHPDTQAYWTEQMVGFFHPDHGVDIDALWIDMNEPANFCPWPCKDPDGFLKGPGSWIDPPPPDPIPYNPRPLPGWPDDFQPPRQAPSIEPVNVARPFPAQHHEQVILPRTDHSLSKHRGIPGRDLLNPPYKIRHAEGPLSNHGMDTDLPHAQGFAHYDVHNLYGLMMSQASRAAMLARRPHLRPLVVTRSTFLSSGRAVAHWLGDNVSNWEQYRQSIRHMLQFTAFFQMPMVGADVCGFLYNTTEHLCARWTRLGAFYPFFRNHNSEKSTPQELYRWDLTAEAARKGIEMRYRLLDYIYTALHRQTIDGTPILFPLWMAYPHDAKTAAIELQFFYGPSLIVCPVVQEGSTEVSVYLPHGLFYDFESGRPVHGHGRHVTLQNVGYTDIPVFVQSGHIIPLRVSGANTTTMLRTLDFELLIAPSRTSSGNKAEGSLYLDDGVSLEPQGTSEIRFTLSDNKLVMKGKLDYNDEKVKVVRAKIIDPDGASARVIKLDWDLTSPKTVNLDDLDDVSRDSNDEVADESTQIDDLIENVMAGVKSEL